MNQHLFIVLLLLCAIPTVQAQQLLWERAFLHSTGTNGEAVEDVKVMANQQLFVSGGYSPTTPSPPGCTPGMRAYCRIYTLSGALVREQLGRGLQIGNISLDPAVQGGGGWWTGPGAYCQNSVLQTRAFVQRLTPQGDTLRGWWLAGPPRTTAYALLAQGNHLLVAGTVYPMGQTGQAQQYTLTNIDTLGRVRWQRSYPRLPLANDAPAAVVATPRGGYLISGDGQVGVGFQHYLVETDSGGLFRRQRLFQPLGPSFAGGDRFHNQCDVVVLPNAGGYLLSGTADSLVSMITYKQIAYIIRLDTALNVSWVYRHPPALAGTNANSNLAYRLHLLPNGTVGLVLSEARGTGTPVTYLVQVNVATGQRVAFYTLASNTQMAVIPYDWQWVGDGTLLLAGKSLELGVNSTQSYIARHDFRNTPLAAVKPQAGLAANVSLWAYPTPTRGAATATLQVSGLGRRTGELALFDLAGRQVHTQPVPTDGDHRLELSGLPPGLYLARLVAGTQTLGSCKVLVGP